MKKIILSFASSVALLGCAVFATAADLPYGLKSGKPYAGTTLEILSVVTPQFKGLELRDDEFTELTGIRLNWTEIPFTELQEKVSSVGIAANGNFDVVNYLDSWGSANADWFVKLDDLARRDGVNPNRYPDAFIKSATFNNEIKGLPLRAHPQLMFYRKDIFDSLGIGAPKSWDDVVAAGKKIQASGSDVEPLALYYGADGNRQNLFIWINFLWTAGEQIFDANMKPAWDTPGALKATRDYIELHTKHKITAKASVSWVEQEGRAAFQQGTAAMLPVWWWAYSPMLNPEQSVLNSEQVAFTGMPGYQGKTAVTYAISMPFSISRYSRNQEASWEFLKWLSNPDLDRKNAIERNVKGTTIINNVVTHWSSLRDPEVNAANNYIQQAAALSLTESNIMPQIPEWPQVGDILSQAIAKAAAGGNVNRIMRDAAKQADRVMKRAGYY